MFSKATLSTLTAAVALVACSGSEEGTQDLSTTGLPASAQPAVAGDWAISTGNTRAVAARSTAEWQAVWTDRRTQINCDLTFNQAACAATTAPNIDFSNHDLVGIALSSHCAFATSNPSRVFLDFSSDKLVVEFSYACVFKTPLFQEATKTMFFLVPKSSSAIELRGSEA